MLARDRWVSLKFRFVPSKGDVKTPYNVLARELPGAIVG